MENDVLIKEKQKIIEKYGLSMKDYYVEMFLDDSDITNLQEIDYVISYLQKNNINLSSSFASLVIIQCYDDSKDLIYKIDYVLKNKEKLNEEDIEVVIGGNIANIEKKLDIFRKYSKIYELSVFEGFGQLIVQSKLDDIDERLDYIYSSGIKNEYGEIPGMAESIIRYPGADYKEKFFIGRKK